MADNCAICIQIKNIRAGDQARVVHEFAHSFLLVGEHQLYPGYCVLQYKEHVRELHDLAPATSQQLFAEMMTASKAIATAYKPWKLNHASYGNVVPHIHWHIIPRYADDPHKLDPIWIRSAEFGKYKTTNDQAEAVKKRLKSLLG